MRKRFVLNLIGRGCGEEGGGREKRRDILRECRRSGRRIKGIGMILL